MKKFREMLQEKVTKILLNKEESKNFGTRQLADEILDQDDDWFRSEIEQEDLQDFIESGRVQFSRAIRRHEKAIDEFRKEVLALDKVEDKLNSLKV